MCVYVRESWFLSDKRLRTSHTWLGIGRSTVIPEVKKSTVFPEVKKKFHNFLNFHSNAGRSLILEDREIKTVVKIQEHFMINPLAEQWSSQKTTVKFTSRNSFILIHPPEVNHRTPVNVRDTPTNRRPQQSGPTQR